MRKNVLFYLIIIFLFESFIFSFNNNLSELENILKTTNNYIIKKHINYAIKFYKNNLLNSFYEEIKYLKEIDKKHQKVYEKILNYNKPQKSNNPSSNNQKNIDKLINRKFNKAYYYYKESKLNKARYLIEEILDLDKENKTAKNFLKNINDEIFREDKTTSFKDILKTLYNEGMRLYRKGEYEKAYKKLKNANSIDPSNAQIKKYLDIISKKIENSVDEKNKEKLLKEADLLREKGKIKLARKKYKTVLLMDPTNEKSLFYLEKFNKKAIQLFNKSKNLYEKGKILQSYKIIKEAYKYNENNPKIYKFFKKLKMKVAIEKKSIKNKKLANKYYNKGVACFDKGDYEESIKYWKKVLSITPEDEEAKQNIKIAENKLKELKEKKEKEIKNILKEADDLFLMGLLEKAKNKYEYVLRINPDIKEAQEKIKKINLLLSKKNEKINQR